LMSGSGSYSRLPTAIRSAITAPTTSGAWSGSASRSHQNSATPLCGIYRSHTLFPKMKSFRKITLAASRHLYFRSLAFTHPHTPRSRQATRSPARTHTSGCKVRFEWRSGGISRFFETWV
jgi:hypothetical protein